MESSYQTPAFADILTGKTLKIRTGRNWGVLTLSNNTLSMTLTNGETLFSASPDQIKKFYFYDPASGSPNAGAVYSFDITLKNGYTGRITPMPTSEQLGSTVPLTPEQIAETFEQRPNAMVGIGNQEFGTALKQWIKDNKISSNGRSTGIFVVAIFILIAAYVAWKLLHK